MKTISVTVERNFHCLNDDRFIMEKISATIELENGDTPQAAMNIARSEIESNFKTAYPTVEEHLNFNVVRQQNDNYKPIEYMLPKMIDNFANVPTDKKEEPIDKGFNLIDEILKCTNPKVFKTQKYMCKTDEEKAAWNERNKMFFAGEWQPIPITN